MGLRDNRTIGFWRNDREGAALSNLAANSSIGRIADILAESAKAPDVSDRYERIINDIVALLHQAAKAMPIDDLIKSLKDGSAPDLANLVLRASREGRLTIAKSEDGIFSVGLPPSG